MSIWQIGLSAEIIQDGNYDEFKKNDIIDFAVEFVPESLSKSKSSVTKAINEIGSFYSINGKILFIGNGFWVLDIGILIYRQSEPIKGVSVGDWVSGDVYLGIDPFIYSAIGFTISGIPPLIYEWKISTIFIETTPTITSKDNLGVTVLIKDESNLSFDQIEETDSMFDNRGEAEYVVSCELLDTPPQYQ